MARRTAKPAATSPAAKNPITVIRGRLPARPPRGAAVPEPEPPVPPAPEPETEAVFVAAEAEHQVDPSPRPTTPETAMTLLLDLLCLPRPGNQRPMLSYMELRGILQVLRSRHQTGTLVEEINEYLYWADPLPDEALDVRRSVEAMFAGVDEDTLRGAIRINPEARDVIAERHGEHVARELEDSIIEYVGQAMVDAADTVEARDIQVYSVDLDVIRGGGSPPPGR